MIYSIKSWDLRKSSVMLNTVPKLNANNQSIGSRSVLFVFLSIKMTTISALPPSWSIQTPPKFRAAQKCPRSSDR